MLKNTAINRMATVKIAKALGELNREVVFVGGAMVSLYIDDPAAEDIRPTKDIDLAFQITTASQLEALRQALTEKGFQEQADSAVICRFAFEELLVDVMSTQAVGWAPGNRWFQRGFNKAITVHLDDIAVEVLTLPYFLASKMDAFFDRGMKDLYASSDLEDIVYLFNYTSDIAEQILSAADGELRSYLIESIRKMLEDDQILSALPGHLYFDEVDARMEILLDKMKKLTHGLHRPRSPNMFQNFIPNHNSTSAHPLKPSSASVPPLLSHRTGAGE
ncbi:MAG: nucleotidyl transferase AbiEii/AbiGii toxin family protein [Lewinellaceae bacterium]|nr:nucleotidyl transferase AbiEii/AbiGii toxin family protein [Lewinellaceae bacterium]